MLVGILLPNYARWFRGDAITAVLEKSKAIGLDSLWFVDHIIVTPEQRVGYGNGYMDLWTAMSYVAGANQLMNWHPYLGTIVSVIPHRPPIQQAKVIATVDSLSGGKVIIGAGTGYNREELMALGVPYHERGDRADEYLRCMIELWTKPVATFHGKYADFENMTISVRPAQEPHPPILVGATGPRPFRRAAEIGQGWLPGSGSSVQEFEENMGKLLAVWNEYGRTGKPMIGKMRGAHLTDKREDAGGTITRGVETGDQPYVTRRNVVHVQDMVDEVRRFNDLGLDHIAFHLPNYRYEGYDNLGMQLHQMDLLAEHVLPKLARG